MTSSTSGARADITREPAVPRAKARMPALLDIALRSSKAIDQKIAQSLLGAVELLGRIHRPEHIVGRHPAVEGSDHACNSRLAHYSKDVLLLHELRSIPSNTRTLVSQALAL